MQNFAIVLIVLILVAVGAGLAFYYQFYQPLENEKNELLRDKTKYENEVAKLRGIDEEIKRFEKEIAELKEQENKLQTESNQLETVVPRILESTEILAGKFDIGFQDIRFSPLIKAEQWTELPIEFSVNGTFQNMGSFLKIMEERKILNLAKGTMNISVSAADVDPNTQSPRLSVTLTGSVYIVTGGI